MTLGFIGLGRLGAPIAMNLLESGHPLMVYNRTRTKEEALVAKGARSAPSLAELCRQSDIIFSMLSDDAALLSICEEESGLLQQMKAGSVHVSMSTILPHTAEKLYQKHSAKGQHYLAAPVFGRPEAAKARKLNYVIAGDDKVKHTVTPFLKDAGGVNVWDFGNSVQAANTVKLCGNFMIASAMEAIGESINLARKSGVDAEKMWTFFAQTLFNAPIYHTYSNAILKGQFQPAAFTAKLGLKDMRLVNEQAEAVDQAMPLAELLKRQMGRLVDSGRSELDWSAISLAADVK